LTSHIVARIVGIVVTVPIVAEADCGCIVRVLQPSLHWEACQNISVIKDRIAIIVIANDLRHVKAHDCVITVKDLSSAIHCNKGCIILHANAFVRVKPSSIH